MRKVTNEKNDGSLTFVAGICAIADQSLYCLISSLIYLLIVHILERNNERGVAERDARPRLYDHHTNSTRSSAKLLPGNLNKGDNIYVLQTLRPTDYSLDAPLWKRRKCESSSEYYLPQDSFCGRGMREGFFFSLVVRATISVGSEKSPTQLIQ